MQVIGLTGFAGSGKSTVANYLVEEHGFTRLSFAAPLKKMLRTLDPYLEEPADGEVVRLSDLFTLYTEAQIKTGPFGDEYRRLLQVLGTDCIRAVDEGFWVRAALDQMTDWTKGKYVFDDCRFPNEAEVIKEINQFGLWNVSRPGYEAVNGHASEQHAGKMGEKLFLVNGSDIEGLHDQINAALEIMADVAAAR